MMKRKIINQILQWKSTKNKKCLMITGARQVGKTFAIKHFGKSYYQACVYINFEFNENAQKAFSGNLNYHELLLYLSSVDLSITMNPRDTLIIFDEIQSCPRAIVSLKLFAEANEYDVIATGSLLGIALNAVTSYPVGYVDHIHMFPMDYEEFLWANNISNEKLEYLRECYISGTPINEGMHAVFHQLLLKYITVGGMPEAVSDYIQHNDITRVKKIHDRLIESYQYDMAKYASKDICLKVQACFNTIPNQLAKDNKKFQYKLIKTGASAKHYDNSIDWLEKSGLVVKAYRLDSINHVLKLGKNLSTFKLYFFDTGLLLSMYDDNAYQKILINELGLFKGAIYENIIAQFLVANHHELYYYEKGPSLEIDFIIKQNNIIVPIEVKASENTKSKSLKFFIEENQIKRAVKLSKNNINTQHEVIKAYPMYMAMFL